MAPSSPDHEYVLEPLAPFRTLITASTLFGQLAWAARFAGLDVSALLAPFREGRPSFLVSDAFPTGYLPKPILQPLEAPLETSERKAVKNVHLLPAAVWREVLERGEVALLEALRARRLDNAASPVAASLARVGIDRSSLHAAEGVLYEESATYLPRTWSVFVRPRGADWEAWQFEKRFAEIGQTGYGGGASVGRGAFRLVGVNEARLEGPADASGFTSLSAFVPSGLDPRRGWYGLEVYGGRLGGGYGGAEPWKRPYRRVVTGSSFAADPGAVHGRWVEPLAEVEPGVVAGDYGFAYPVGVRL